MKVEHSSREIELHLIRVNFMRSSNRFYPKYPTTSNIQGYNFCTVIVCKQYYIKKIVQLMADLSKQIRIVGQL
jgi:hypothetical protein